MKAEETGQGGIETRIDRANLEAGLATASACREISGSGAPSWLKEYLFGACTNSRNGLVLLDSERLSAAISESAGRDASRDAASFLGHWSKIQSDSKASSLSNIGLETSFPIAIEQDLGFLCRLLWPETGPGQTYQQIRNALKGVRGNIEALTDLQSQQIASEIDCDLSACADPVEQKILLLARLSEDFLWPELVYSASQAAVLSRTFLAIRGPWANVPARGLVQAVRYCCTGIPDSSLLADGRALRAEEIYANSLSLQTNIQLGLLLEINKIRQNDLSRSAAQHKLESEPEIQYILGAGGPATAWWSGASTSSRFKRFESSSQFLRNSLASINTRFDSFREQLE